MAKGAGGAGRAGAASPIGGNRNTALVDGFRASIEALDGVEMFSLYINPNTGYLNLDDIRISKQQRGQGKGSEVMLRLTDFADKHGFTIDLTPDAYEKRKAGQFHGPSARLTEWYKTFGFKVNRGRDRDFTTRAMMIRRPRG